MQERMEGTRVDRRVEHALSEAQTLRSIDVITEHEPITSCTRRCSSVFPAAGRSRQRQRLVRRLTNRGFQAARIRGQTACLCCLGEQKECGVTSSSLSVFRLSKVRSSVLKDFVVRFMFEDISPASGRTPSL
ncbi:hypothetical protein OJAV_G00084880 [Oryzias javanicus]|uniref:Uncharacterized protein n=1 Tax=Oryzias javanicus TaxID=123683 RepID=A0A3S2MVH2_ORYJA|nr:hypothetical protein OJAV_G00084880 [Oryzias javanicus]